MFKKFISFMISLSIISALFVGIPVQAEEDYSMLDSIGITIDVNALDEPVTRIELAEVAIQLTKASLITEGKAMFIDIPQKHKLFATVNTVYLNGLMSGYPDGTFRPEANAYTTDASGMILTMLGYGHIVDSPEFSAAKLQDIARSIGIFDGVSGGVLTNRNLGNMLLNMLDAGVFKITGMDGDALIYNEGTESYLEKMTDYETITGIVQAAGAATIYGVDPVMNQQTVIDGITYVNGGIDMLPYLGLNVRAVVDPEAGKIISVKLEKSVDEIIIPADDIESYSSFTYEYYKNENSVRKESIPSDARLIFNGTNMTYDENLMKPLEGSVRLTDTDSNGTYDLVVITSAVYMKVLSYIEDEQLVDSITNTSIDIKSADITCYSGGVAVSADNLTKGTLIRVIPDKMEYSVIGETMMLAPSASECKNIRIEIVPESKTEGEVLAMREDEITVGTEQMEMSLYLNAQIKAGITDAPTLKSLGTFYKNENGKLIAFDINSRFAKRDSIKYGYLLSFSYDEFEEIVYISFVNEQAQKETITISDDDLKINGVKKTFKQLQNDITTTNTRIFVNGQVKRQLIAYETNAEGKLSNLYIAKDYAHEFILDENGDNTAVKNPDYMLSGYMGYDNENFSLDYSSGKKTILHRSGVNHLYSFNEATVLFEVPKNPDEFTKYKVLASNAATGITKNSRYYLKLYNATDNYEAGAVIIDYSLDATAGSATRDAALETYGGNSQACMITSLVKEWDEEEQELKELLAGKEFTYSTAGLTGIMKDVALNCEDPEYEDTDTRVNGSGSNKPFGFVKWNQLEVGDVILHGFDNEGNIKSFTVLFRYNELYNADGSVNYRDINPLQGNEATVKLTVSRVVSILDTGEIVFTPSAEDDYTQFLKSKCENICLFDGKNSAAIDISELRIGDTIFTRSQDGKLREVFVFRED